MAAKIQPPVARRPDAKVADETAKSRRLSFKERQELDALPSTIEKLEADIAALHGEMVVPEFYRRSSGEIAAEQARLKLLEEQLTAAYHRWEQLELLRS